MELSTDMKKIKEELMIAACTDYEAGVKVSEICKKYGISATAFHRYKAKYGGLNVKEIEKVKAVEREETKLKRKVKEQERIIKALQAVVKKKF